MTYIDPDYLADLRGRLTNMAFADRDATLAITAFTGELAELNAEKVRLDAEIEGHGPPPHHDVAQRNLLMNAISRRKVVERQIVSLTARVAEAHRAEVEARRRVVDGWVTGAAENYKHEYVILVHSLCTYLAIVRTIDDAVAKFNSDAAEYQIEPLQGVDRRLRGEVMPLYDAISLPAFTGGGSVTVPSTQE